MGAAKFADLFALERVFTSTLARPGTRYTVRGSARRVPPLAFPGDPKTWLLRPAVLDRLADLMAYADRLLVENDIDYVVCYGTLLGAYRHQGLIPWDDDVDLFIVDREAGMRRLAGLAGRVAADGFRLIRVNDYYKLAHASSPLGFPYLDLYGLWDQMAMDEIHPIARMPFEDFEVNVPCKGEEILLATYGADPSPLETVVHDRVVAHRLGMAIFELLGERAYNLVGDTSAWVRQRLGLEKCNP